MENQKKSQLIVALREAVAVVQMIFFSKLRHHLEEQNNLEEQGYRARLCGAITNEVFGCPNPEEEFANFRRENIARIEQEMLSLATPLAEITPILTDALRIQTLCDSQEEIDSSAVLSQADNCGFLVEDREIPLPSSFMATVRELGSKYNFVIPPVEIGSEDDKEMLNDEQSTK